MDNGSTAILALQDEFDNLTETVLKNHVSLWLWEIDSAAEWYKIIYFVFEFATQLVYIDSICYLDTYYELLRRQYVSDWEVWYGNLVHHYWTLTIYFFYYIYGAIWNSHYDMAFAVGIYTKIIFGVSFEDAETYFSESYDI